MSGGTLRCDVNAEGRIRGWTGGPVDSGVDAYEGQHGQRQTRAGGLTTTGRPPFSDHLLVWRCVRRRRSTECTGDGREAGATRDEQLNPERSSLCRETEPTRRSRNANRDVRYALDSEAGGVRGVVDYHGVLGDVGDCRGSEDNVWRGRARGRGVQRSACAGRRGRRRRGPGPCRVTADGALAAANARCHRRR